MFKEKFSAYRTIPIGIYGIGNNARAILSDSDDFNISCVIVQTPTNGFSFFGKPVISIEEAVLNGLKLIVIAAEADIEIIIYERIKTFCIENEVDIWGLYLGDMRTLFENSFFLGLNDNDYITKDIIEKQIDEHDVISFDIFDTLLMRRTLAPRDVFKIVELKAISAGIDAEGFAFKRSHAELTNPKQTPSLEEIYSYLVKTTGMSNNSCEELMKIEIEVENDVIIPREVMCNVFNYAKDKGKRVYLVSDMYLTRDKMIRLLDSSGITGYNGLLISCEIGTTKNEDLFEFFLRECRGNSHLHIGDNRKVDGLSALTHGIDAITVSGTYEMFEKSFYCDVLRSMSNINERSMIALFAGQLFKDPFQKKNKISEPYEYGYLFIAPVITSFMIWLIEQIKDGGFNKILFAARDGYLFNKLYETYREIYRDDSLPDGIYFYTSRKSCLRAYCRNKENLDEVLQQYSFSMQDVLRNYSDGCGDYAINEDDVFEKANAEYMGYKKYIRSLNIENSDKIAIVDLVSGGTCQYYLENMFFGQIQGLYLCQGASWVKRVPRIKSMIQEFSTDLGAYFSKIEQVKLLESVMTCSEPSLAGFSENGERIFLMNKATEEYKRFVEGVQEGICAYFNTYIKHLYVPGITIHSSVYTEIMNLRNMIEIDEKLLRNIHIEDELMGTYF